MASLFSTRGAVAVALSPMALYVFFILISTIPTMQRHFLYAHKINDLWRIDLDKPEAWGFATNQVTPFSIQTSDKEALYAWHILPLPLYLKNEALLSTQAIGFSNDFTATESFRLLKDDPEARLVIYFHGNAGHIAQAQRPQIYHALTDTSTYHVLSFDYRGFGRSTGTPTEAGIIDDATAVVEWAVKTAGIPPRRIVLLGQSLGTAVISGVAERFAIRNVEFAGIVLVAGFSDLASMLSGYRMGGVVPVLGPLKNWPYMLQLVQTFVVDKWHSANRLANIVRHTKGRLRINLIHAKNDRDIPWTEDNKLFRAAVNESVGIHDDVGFQAWKDQLTVKKGDDAFVTTWTAKPDIIVRQELFPYGEHNTVMGFAPVALAVMRSFDLHGTGYA
ncbi:Alpha/Beta hydrolase protein [Stachybotrys elegans]|uniref:Alpha/Beta hydrolase protein n=1 Tax=Stachybotrys elegans TaxID=80388 RepID=A0A8K0SLW8_9HYPO|nr:Alpha/Beta hydrolase protein [Stachybotrys elegans]